MHRCTEQNRVCFIVGFLTAVQVWISGSVPALLTSPPLVYRQSSGCPFQSDAARFTDCKCRVNISCSGALGTETLLKTRDVKNTQQLIWVHRELKDVHIHVPVSWDLLIASMWELWYFLTPEVPYHRFYSTSCLWPLTSLSLKACIMREMGSVVVTVSD